MEENILPRAPGHYLGAALNTLPPASSATEGAMDATIDGPGISAVRVTAKRIRSKRGKSVSYFWSPESALLVA